MFIRVVAVLCIFGALAACRESYRIEPLLLENRQIVERTIKSYEDEERIGLARQAAIEFVKAYRDGKCEAAWDMLTDRYKALFAHVAGDDARKQFCEGYRVKDDMLVQGAWSDFVLGARPHYITSVPPEMGAESIAGEDLFFVVQKDGTYTGFILMDGAGEPSIEPF